MNPYRQAREVENDALSRMTGPSPKEIGWDEGFAAGRAADPNTEGVWPDQSAMHGVLLDQIKDAQAADCHGCLGGYDHAENPTEACVRAYLAAAVPTDGKTLSREFDEDGRALDEAWLDAGTARAEDRARIVKALREAAHGGNRGQPGSFWVGWRAAARAIEEGWAEKPETDT